MQTTSKTETFDYEVFTTKAVTELKNLVRNRQGQEAVDRFVELTKEVEERLGAEMKKVFMADIRLHIERFV